MGLGDYPLGFGPLGHDPIADPSESTLREPPKALFYDPATRDFRLRSDGAFEAVHPVDQEVAIRMTFLAGSFGGDAELGSKVWTIEYLGQDLEAKVRDYVRTALAPMLERGDIEISAIPVERHSLGGMAYAVEYFNLRLDPQQTTTRRFAPAA
jgi:hypothetical protein